MARPEDVRVGQAAQIFCRDNQVDLDEVRHARATGEPAVWEGLDLEEGWYVFEGERLHGDGRLRLLVGPDSVTVADVRLIA